MCWPTKSYEVRSEMGPRCLIGAQTPPDLKQGYTNIKIPTDSIPTPQNKKRFNRAAGVLMKR